MRDTYTSFYSEGLKVEALIRRPDTEATGKGYPVIVQGPGSLGLMSSPISKLYNEVFVNAGFAVVALNYRGFGDSEGEKGWIQPDTQLQDLINTLTFVETVPDLDHTRIGVYGHGGTGGGNAIMLTAVDQRVKCVAVQSPVADGYTWLRSMRRNYEWIAYLERLEANAKKRLVDGKGEIVNPREEIMVATPQRRAAVQQAATGKATVDSIVGNEFHLASAEHIMRYRPIDYVAKIAPRPLLVMALKRDAVTPEDHGAQALFDKAGAPKTLLSQNEAIAHYSSYDQNLDVVGPLLVDFYKKALVEPGRLTLVNAGISGFSVDQVG